MKATWPIVAALVALSCKPTSRAPSTASPPSTAAPDPGPPPEPMPATTPTPAPSPAPAAAPTPSPPEEPGMLQVPGGSFTMGADRGGEDDEHPAHVVRLSPFWLDRTEVTNGAYRECVGAGACKRNDAHIPTEMKAGDDAEFARPDQPVVGVTWDDATAYCAFRGKRLPREAEFERAIRGDDGRRYPWGNEPPTPERTVFGRALGGPRRGATDDVGTHPPGRGPYGHDDLAGNVWEWMADEYDPLAYTRAGAGEGVPATCPQILRTQDDLRDHGKQGFTGSNPIPRVCEHVLRGGAFNYDGPGLRSTNRVHHPGHFRLVMAGFRCAKDARDGG